MVVFLSGGLSEEKTTFRVSSIYRGRNNNKNQEYLKAFEIFSWLSNSNFVACYQYCKLLQNVFLPADKQRTLMVCSDENGWAPEKYLSKTHLKWVCDISRLGCGTGTFKSILPVPQIYCKKHCQKPLSTKIYLGNQKKVYNIKVDSGDWMIEENHQSNKLY